MGPSPSRFSAVSYPTPALAGRRGILRTGGWVCRPQSRTALLRQSRREGPTSKPSRVFPKDLPPKRRAQQRTTARERASHRRQATDETPSREVGFYVENPTRKKALPKRG